MKTIAWAITGAGSLLEESVDSVIQASQKYLITVYISKAGFELLRAYGLLNKLFQNIRGPYPAEIVIEGNEGFSYPSAMRVYRGVYSYVVVSPASLNTVSKIIHGISDSLVSNLVSHSLKNRVEVLITPVDSVRIESSVPLVIERSKCMKCGECIASYYCSTGALTRHLLWKVKFDLSKCNLCRICSLKCPYGAVRFNVKVNVEPHLHYVDLVTRLMRIPGVRLFKHPYEILSYIGM